MSNVSEEVILIPNRKVKKIISNIIKLILIDLFVSVLLFLRYKMVHIGNYIFIGLVILTSIFAFIEAYRYRIVIGKNYISGMILEWPDNVDLRVKKVFRKRVLIDILDILESELKTIKTENYHNVSIIKFKCLQNLQFYINLLDFSDHQKYLLFTHSKKYLI